METVDRYKKVNIFWRILGWVLFCAIVFIGFYYASTGGFTFPPRDCKGKQRIAVGKARTYWEIAKRDFPSSDPRAVGDALIKMNGDILQPGGTILAPLACR